MGSVKETNLSYWLDTTEQRSFPTLEPDHRCEVLVIGGGITGLTAAYLLAKDGAGVSLIEAGSVCSGTTGYTTAKVTSQHGLMYAELVRKQGEERARLYADAQETAIAQIERVVTDEKIACDWMRLSSYVYTEKQEMLEELESEAEAAEKLGLPAGFRTDTDLPFAVAGAVRFDDQALFHPVRYGLGLADAIERRGGRIFEHSRALDIDGGGPCTIKTEHGVVRADVVIVATQIPFLFEGLFFARTEPIRSYVIAAPFEQLPDAMYISAEEPTRSIRPHPGSDGPILLLGGGGHPVGREERTEDYYGDLESWAASRFQLQTPAWRWSAQDFVPADGVPFIGALSDTRQGVLIATGFKKWGMTNGTVAGMLFADLIGGRDNQWVELFDPTRIKPAASAGTVLSQGLETAKSWVADRIGSPGVEAVDEIVPGSGRIVKIDGDQVAVYRDDQGAVHAVSAVCTHMGCIVRFNEAERSWDCPCHGSRFGTDGRVLNAPATQDLEQRSAEMR